MSYIIFLDESGQDQQESPYEVLAGVAVKDQDLWNLITALQQAELELFGRRYSEGNRELKAKKLLKTKTFRLAAGQGQMEPVKRQELARECLEHGAGATPDQIAALAQAKLDFVRRALVLCARFRCKAFASIMPRGAPREKGGSSLRKDYAYLFERFFYYLEDISPDAQGLVVFDELEHSQSHILIDQMAQYFQRTQKGQTRAGRIIPEPFFVHSHLTTAVQLADLVAYIIAWGVRVANMGEPARAELVDIAQLVVNLRHLSVREVGDIQEFKIWSFAVIDNLRPQERPTIQ
jgi:hypothetical protein